MRLNKTSLVLLAILIFTGCEDPNKAAIGLAVEAKAKFDRASREPFEDRLRLYKEVRSLIDLITSKYKQTAVAYDLASTGKIAGIDISALDTKIDQMTKRLPYLKGIYEVKKFRAIYEKAEPYPKSLAPVVECHFLTFVKYMDADLIQLYSRIYSRFQRDPKKGGEILGNREQVAKMLREMSEVVPENRTGG